MALLEEGEVASLSDIAHLEKTDVSYVARVLNLTTLAPEIVEAILDDALPDAISLNDVAINPPLSWTNQIELLDHTQPIEGLDQSQLVKLIQRTLQGSTGCGLI